MRTTQRNGMEVDASRDRPGSRDAEGDCYQSQKMEALGRLVGGLAHGFNNELTVIGGYSRLLLARIGPDHALWPELLQIQRASDRATTLTRQLLSFMSKHHGPAEVLDLSAVVADQARMLRPLLGDDIELRTFLDEGLPAVEAVPTQVALILLNLAANARDAMPRGGQLTLTTGWQDAAPPATGFVTLRVSDTGCGMSEEVKTHLFETFFTTKPVGRGTGLGLATVADLVEQMGGHIDVESQPGCGSTFTLYLPPAAPRPGAAAAPAEAPAPRGSETVLLVEDEENVRALFQRVLGQHGYTVLAATTAAEALALARHHPQPIDLLVTGVVLPRITGQQLAAQLATCHPRLRVLFVSGRPANAPDPSGVVAAGAALLQKPITPEELLCKIREVLGPS